MKGMMAAVGIEKGKPFAPDDRMKKIFADAAAIGNAGARTISYSPRNPGQFVYAARWSDVRRVDLTVPSSSGL